MQGKIKNKNKNIEATKQASKAKQSMEGISPDQYSSVYAKEVIVDDGRTHGQHYA